MLKSGCLLRSYSSFFSHSVKSRTSFPFNYRALIRTTYCTCLARTAAPYSGFTTYTQLTEGADNSGVTKYSTPCKSSTLFVYVQILPTGGSHASLFSDFASLCSNYGANNISIIPRLRYGYANGNMSPEPNDVTLINADVQAWLRQLQASSGACAIPVVQAGVLGQWGEWHDGPFCSVSGNASSAAQKQMKLDLVRTLMGYGGLVALRYPQDFAMLYPALTADQQDQLTMHDDCLLAEGPDGADEGTFVQKDGKTPAEWRQYTIDMAGNYTFGGEPCPDTYAWDDRDTVCSSGPEGLVAYINDMQISYLNPLFPPGLETLFKSQKTSDLQCIQNIQNALQSWS